MDWWFTKDKLKTFHVCADDLPYGDLFVNATSKDSAILFFSAYLKREMPPVTEMEGEDAYPELKEGQVLEQH